MESGVGANASDYCALRGPARKLREHGLPRAIRGDPNDAKSELPKTAALKACDAARVKTLEPTCARSQRPIGAPVAHRLL